METVNFLATLWGVYLVAIPLSLLLKPVRIKELFALRENVITSYMGGILSLMVGTLMILTYNVWDGSWTTAISVLGWLAVAKGVILLFCTEKAISLQKQAKVTEWIPYVFLAVIFIGLWLIYMGQTA